MATQTVVGIEMWLLVMLLLALLSRPTQGIMLIKYVGYITFLKVVIGVRRAITHMCAVLTIVVAVTQLISIPVSPLLQLSQVPDVRINATTPHVSSTQPACVSLLDAGARSMSSSAASGVCAGKVASRGVPALESTHLFDKTFHKVPVSPVTQCFSVWCKELEQDSDSIFILDGIKNGFALIDDSAVPVSCSCDNYKSATVAGRVLAEKQIEVELAKGRYVISESKPPIVSALGAIPKSATKIRLIHDLSRPVGGVNQHSTDNSVKFPTIDDATRYMNSSSYLAKIDLSEAYRSIPIHPSSYRLTGLQWQFNGDLDPTYFFMLDCRLGPVNRVGYSRL
jgi:hypothetical protein